MQKPEFSIVIPSCNEGDMLHMTVNDVLKKTEYPGGYEVIIVDDGSTDGSCDPYREEATAQHVKVIDTPHIGVARARNAGFEQARGNYIVFMDAHCKVSKDWLSRYEKALADPQVAIVGPAFTQLNQPDPKGCGMMWTSDLATDTMWYIPQSFPESYDIPLTPGGSQAFRTDTFRKVGRYDEGFARWGSEDLELCLRCWTLGYRVKVDPQIEVQHYFRNTRNFEVDQSDVAYNFLRMVHFHFSPERINRVIHHLEGHPEVKTALNRVEKSDISQIRNELDLVRKFDDNWFFSVFG